VAQPDGAGLTLEERPSRPWHVFATFLAAVGGVIVAAEFALELLKSAYPDTVDLLSSLPGLLGTSLAASSALLLTLLVVVRPLDAARFRLLPGWETGTTLAVMVLAVLALAQALGAGATLLGLDDRGPLELIRRVLEQTRGPDLFGAVLVFGLGAGVAEEVFFRGYMQSRLREHWSPSAAVLATSSAFAAVHFDPSGVHTVQAFALSLYLGFVVELSGSTLPSIVCHVVNNVVAIGQTALGFAVMGRDVSVILVVAGTAVFVASVLWLRRAVPDQLA
jgi:uncharacterized protein